MGQTQTVTRIFHIAEMSGWAEAQADGMYRRSTLGKTLDELGFIHCSRREQVEVVANAVYRGHRDLVLLIIDPQMVHAEIREENLNGGLDLFPHIYGPLNTDAVTDVLPFVPGGNGSFVMPTSASP